MKSTPQRLKFLVALCWVLTGILGATILSSAFEHRDAVHAIGVDAVPSVIATHRIKVEIESLDADLINEMLVPPEQARRWSTDFAKNRVEIGRHLLAATRSSFGDDEHAALEKISDTLGLYLMAAQETLDAHRRGDKDTAEALATYRTAFAVLETEMIPAANALNQVSDDDLERAFEAQVHHSHVIRNVVGVLGLLLIAILLAIQRYMAQRFRRRISLGLCAAIGFVLVLMSVTIGAFRANDHALEVMKVHSYDDIDEMLASLANVYEAKSAQSRWLFDLENRDVAEARYKEFVAKATFPDDARATIAAFETYRTRDEVVRSLERSGDHAGAITFAISGDGNVAFDAFDRALEDWVSHDQRDLDHHTEEAFASVKSLPILAPVLTLLIAISIAFAMRPRLKEYAR